MEPYVTNPQSGFFIDTPKKLTDQVYSYLFDGIRGGRWKAGSKLPSEAELCLELEASRSTVRSAIERLNGIGMVKSHQGKGTFVCQLPALSAETALHVEEAKRVDVFEFRRILESESAALTAIRATAANIEELERSVAAMAEGQTLREVAEQDMRFHELIARFSGNIIIQGIFEVMRPTYAEMFMVNVMTIHKAGVEGHRNILLAIQSRDIEAARRGMADHVKETMRAVCSIEN